MFFAERVTELTRKMLRKKRFLMITNPIVPPEFLQPFLSAHLEYMIDLEKRGLVFASGPLTDGVGPPTAEGLPVPRAKAAAEPRALAEADPFYVHGLRGFFLKEWTVIEGRLS